jgi:hypothetical protein
MEALCIDQSNTFEKASQVSATDQLYKGAAETIMWPGPDPFYGRAFETEKQILEYDIEFGAYPYEKVRGERGGIP